MVKEGKLIHFILKVFAKIIAYLEIKSLIDQNIVNQQEQYVTERRTSEKLRIAPQNPKTPSKSVY